MCYNVYMDKKYKINEFAKLMNVSVKTLQRWDNEAILKAFRTPTNRRYYTHNQYLEYSGDSLLRKIRGKVEIYARISIDDGKGDLDTKVEFLKQYASSKGIMIDIVEDGDKLC